LQFIDIDRKVTILDNIIKSASQLSDVEQIALAVSSLPGNEVFHHFGRERGVQVIAGDDEDMLGRIIAAGDAINAQTILQISSESPFLYTDNIETVAMKHITEGYDLSKTDRLPDGAGYCFFSIEALKTSHHYGERRHRSELVSLFIHENQERFKIFTELPPKELQRPEVRVTVDYPEDLIFCRRLYRELGGPGDSMTISKIIEYWDQHPDVRADVEKFGIDWGRGRLWD